jgi:trk system potassium uptake protein TrkH
MTHDGRRPGDRRVRVERQRPELITVKAPRTLRRPPTPAVVLILGFAALIAIGSFLLALPISSASGDWTGSLNAIFTATSAVCVTGLVVVDTGTYWSGFGQAVILALIQLGGFGFMTSSTFLLVVLTRRRTTLRDRVLVQESLGVRHLGESTSLLKRVAIFTFLVEMTGTAILVVHQLVRSGPGTSDLWWGAFHAISAFNNAGFDINGNYASLVAYQRDWVVLPVIGLLIVLGGIGYAIVADVASARRWTRMALETKVVLTTTAALLVAGAIMIGVTEWSNPATLGSLEPMDRALNAAFHSVTPRTAGFNSLEMAGFFDQTLVLTMALMFIGGASGSTAGGVKVNTFSVLGIAILSSIRGRPSAEAFGRRIPHGVVYRALSVALLFIAFAFLTALLLQALVDQPFLDTTFETLSALGTVGLTTGITPSLSEPGKVLVAFAMFAGRLGPLTLVLALAARARAVPYRPAVETLRIG